jgi:hypothetical protein
MRIARVCRRAASCFALVSVSLLGASAYALPTEAELAELRAQGLGQSRGDPVPMVPEGDEAQPLGPKKIKHGVIFVNFDPEPLTMGGENSIMNQSMLYGGELEPYGTDMTARAALMEAVRLDWEAYDVDIVDTRPTAGDYTMNVMTATNFLGPGVLGVAPLDCDDLMTHNNVTFAFHTATDGFGAATQATTVSQEVAHSYGLEHVDDPADILNPTNMGGDPTFKDECIATVGGGTCPAQHEASCGDAVTQNSHQELLAIFGSSAPDVQAPTVFIASPADGAEFEEGAEFLIEAIANDDRQITELELFNGDQSIKVVTEQPYTWEVFDIPEGYYVFTVTATDKAGNSTESDSVEVIVGNPPLPEEEGGDDEDADEDGSGTDAGMDEDGSDKGCGCGSARGRDRNAWLMLGLAVALRRRRIA